VINLDARCAPSTSVEYKAIHSEYAVVVA
jgi:hypothetical protein